MRARNGDEMDFKKRQEEMNQKFEKYWTSEEEDLKNLDNKIIFFAIQTAARKAFFAGYLASPVDNLDNCATTPAPTGK